MKWGKMNVFPHFYINFPLLTPSKPKKFRTSPYIPVTAT